MAVVVVVLLARVHPFGDRAVFVDAVGRKLLQHALPAFGVLAVTAFDQADGFDEVTEKLTHKREIHGGIHADAGRVALRRGMAERVVLRRVARIAVEETVRTLHEEVLVKQSNLAHERNGTLGEEFAVAGVEPVIEINLGKPGAAASPKLHMRLEVFLQTALGRHVERWQDAAAGEHVFRVRAEVVHAPFEQIEDALDAFGQAARQRRPDGHLEVFVEEKGAPPRRQVVAVPDALEVRWQGAFGGGGNEQVAAEIRQTREQGVGHIAAVGFQQKLVVREVRALHIEVEYTATVALAVNRLVAGLQVAAGDERAEALGLGFQLRRRGRDEHGRHNAATGLRRDADRVSTDARGGKVTPVGDDGAGSLLGAVEARSDPPRTEGCRLADVERLLAIGVVDGFGEVLRAEPQRHLRRRAAFLAGIENHAVVGRRNKRRALVVTSVEFPIHARDTFGEIQPAAVVTERAGNFAADVQNGSGQVVRAVGDVAEFAPGVAIDIVRRAEIPGVEQAADFREQVGAFGQVRRDRADKVALVVEKNALMGEAAELHRAEHAVAQWRGVPPVECRTLHPRGVDAFVVLSLVHWFGW